MADTEHQWLLIATYGFSEAELEAMLASSEPAKLRFEKLTAIQGPACFRCEGMWHQMRGKPCPGGERLPKDIDLKLRRLHVVEEIDREL